MLAYEELKGSSGKEIWFRPTRFDARKLFPNNPPRVRVKSSSYQLHNISLTGIAVVAKQAMDEELSLGETVPIIFQQAGLSIFEGRARVCRTETTPFGSKYAFSLVDSYVDFDRLLSRNVQAQIAANGSFLSTERSALVPKEYRAFCSDVLGVLRSYRALLDENLRLTNSFPRSFDHVGAYEACESRLVEQWRSLWLTGNDIVRGVMPSRDAREATKEFTELVLTPEMRAGAIWDRSYGKPLGYPGDYKIMNQVYDWERVGDNVYQQLMHRLGLEVAECIATRMHLVRGKIADMVRDRGQDRHARILSLGSGPAREIETFLETPQARMGKAEFTLVDQETLALSHAYDRIYPALLNLGGLGRINSLNISFTDILRANGGLNQVPPQDLIYSLGLLDYLSDRRARILVGRLYEALSPGGLLIIGNMNETALSNLWPMEFIADWSLEYRNDTVMRAWAEGLGAHEFWTETEKTGRVRLLFVRKL
ncbi:MAG TPA: class I SAM-dependent methyltransferase [Rhizomicrobium sp.]|nr:class I SAM-dependent methyltransferase [Rhizomicrobium sp.]